MGACLSAPTSQSPNKLRPGHLVGDSTLRVVKQLGEGSWSECYLVERVKDGRRYALKRTLINELSEAEKWIAVNEVRLLASLSHPNVVDYKQGFVEGGCLYVIMEVVPNGDMSGVIEKHRRQEARISEETVWGYLLQMAVGLQYLHSSGIVHRDVKPANILIGREGVLKIADLGVAGLLHMGSSKLQIGTPQYMAPEMHAGHSYSFAADVWSLGCLIYELCALEPLFQDREEEVVARKVLATTLPPAIPTKYSPELQILLNRMMQHDPELRPSTEEILNSPQLQSRMNLLPTELETSLSLRNASLDCMEGLPMLPAIDIPDDLHDLNQRLPPPRYSSDNLHEDGALEMAARFGAPAIKPAPAPPAASGAAAAAPEQEQEQQLPHLHRIGSPVTVLESELCSAGSGSVATPSGGGTGGSDRLIDACVAAALEEEKAAAAAVAADAGQTSSKQAVKAPFGFAQKPIAASPFAAMRQQHVQPGGADI